MRPVTRTSVLTMMKRGTHEHISFPHGADHSPHRSGIHPQRLNPLLPSRPPPKHPLHRRLIRTIPNRKTISLPTGRSPTASISRTQPTRTVPIHITEGQTAAPYTDTSTGGCSCRSRHAVTAALTRIAQASGKSPAALGNAGYASPGVTDISVLAGVSAGAAVVGVCEEVRAGTAVAAAAAA